MRLRVTNVGEQVGTDVPQLYLAFPAAAGEPPLLLRGFARTSLLAPGGSEEVPLRLAARDLSVWKGGEWVLARGRYVAHVGSSSRDLRLERSFEV